MLDLSYFPLLLLNQSLAVVSVVRECKDRCGVPLVEIVPRSTRQETAPLIRIEKSFIFSCCAVRSDKVVIFLLFFFYVTLAAFWSDSGALKAGNGSRQETEGQL